MLAPVHVVIDTSDRTPGATGTTAALLVQSEYADGSLTGSGPGSPTVKVVAHLPFAAVPDPVPGWTISQAGTDVTWSGGTLAAGGTVVFDLQVPALPDAPSVTVPVDQSYADGRTVAWTGPAGDARPAPVLLLDGSSGADGITSITNGTGTGPVAPRTASSSSGFPWEVVYVGVPLVGVVAAAFLVRRRRPLSSG